MSIKTLSRGQGQKTKFDKKIITRENGTDYLHI